MRRDLMLHPFLAPSMLLAVLLVGATPATAGTVPRSGPPSDAYGYTLLATPASECPMSFVDICATGTPLAFTAVGAAQADDDGGAILPLAQPFELYGSAVPGLVVSTNGYLAAAEFAAEDGGDFSNDEHLPAVPSNDTGVAARVMVYHDDLKAANGGDVRYQFFATCPRRALDFDEACTIVQWSAWGFVDRADTFDVQALLYHTSFAVVVQIGASDSAAGATSTRGLQRGDARVALVHREAAPGGTGLCFFDPRFPASGRAADLALRLSDGQSTAFPGDTLRYSLVVTNAGPSPVGQAVLTSSFPVDLEDCAWTCTASAGSSCAASGDGPVADSPSLVSGGFATYSIECRVADSPAGAALEVTAALTAQAGVTDPEPSSNQSIDRDLLVHPLAPRNRSPIDQDSHDSRG